MPIPRLGLLGGVVIDARSGFVSHATIVVVRRDDPARIAYSALTGDDGHYMMIDLLPGDYEVTVYSGNVEATGEIEIRGDHIAMFSMQLPGSSARSSASSRGRDSPVVR